MGNDMRRFYHYGSNPLPNYPRPSPPPMPPERK